MPFSTIPEAHRGHPRRAGWSSSSTTRTARTRATSRSRPRRSRPRSINFMARYGRGLDLPADDRRAARRAAHPADGADEQNSARFGTAFCVPIEAQAGHHHRHLGGRPRAHGARRHRPRARSPSDLARPGHMFPLRAQTGGVLVRAGPDRGRRRPRAARRPLPGGRHLRDHERGRHDGARAAARARSAASTALRMITIKDLIRYRMQHGAPRAQDRRGQPAHRATAASASTPSRA